MSTQRIAKWLARAGVCSRREAECWIEDGRISCNGDRVATPAFFVTDTDVIAVDGKPVTPQADIRLWRYHKPAGLVTTHADPQNRPTVFASLPPSLPRLISVGRLDLNSEGLLLLTNHGGLARHLELPSSGWARTYRVRIRGLPDDATLRALRSGVTIDAMHYRPMEVRVDQAGTNSWLTVTLHEGKNREIRNVFAHFGHTVSRLIRIRYGPFQLGKLSQGGIAPVNETMLRHQFGDFFRANGQ